MDFGHWLKAVWPSAKAQEGRLHESLGARSRVGERVLARLRTPTLFRLVAIAAICVGAMEYILWRPDSLTVFRWLSFLGLDGAVRYARQAGAVYATRLPDWVCFSLPQGLWVFGGSLAMQTIWRNPGRPEQQFWMSLVLVLAVCGELGQSVGLVQGVFDPVDLITTFAAFALALGLAASGASAGRPRRTQA